MEINKDNMTLKNWQCFVGPPNKTCWLCSKAQYTLFFAKIDKAKAQSRDLKLQLLPQVINKSNHCMVAMTEEMEFQMEPIREFSERVDAAVAKKFNYLGYFREMSLMPSVAHRLADLTPELQQ